MLTRSGLTYPEISSKVCHDSFCQLENSVSLPWVMYNEAQALLIPKMKEPLRGIRFRTVPEILQAVDRSIRTINTTGATKGILRLPHRWQRVVHNAGDYVEGQ